MFKWNPSEATPRRMDLISVHIAWTELHAYSVSSQMSSKPQHRCIALTEFNKWIICNQRVNFERGSCTWWLKATMRGGCECTVGHNSSLHAHSVQSVSSQWVNNSTYLMTHFGSRPPRLHSPSKIAAKSCQGHLHQQTSTSVKQSWMPSGISNSRIHALYANIYIYINIYAHRM